MKIFLPFTHLRCETFLACPGATLVPLFDHEKGYGEYWMHRWMEGATFINVEQDVVPHAGVLQEMWDCPEPYCRTEYAYPYSGSRVDTSPIGCAKFSDSFIAANHGLFPNKGLHWHDPQHLILNASLNKGHVHGPPSLHIHVNDDWPLDAKMRYATP